MDNLYNYYITIWNNLRQASSMKCMYDSDDYRRVRLYNGYMIHQHRDDQIGISQVPIDKEKYTWKDLGTELVVKLSLVEAMQYIDTLEGEVQ